MKNWTAAVLLFLFLLPLVSAQLTPNIWKKFIGEPVPVGTPDLINYSYAGYKNGEEAIPEDFALPVFDVTDYGAVPDDGKSDTEGIKAALHAADTGQQGGIVFFPSGHYDVILDGEPTDPIVISGNNVILRGSGAEGAARGGTTIKQHNHLTNIGTLFRTPWRSNGRGSATRVKGTFPRGTQHFDVENASRLVNYRFIEIRKEGILGADWHQYSSRPITDMPMSYTSIRDGIRIYEIHEIDRIVGDRVYVKAPVLTHLNSNFNVNWRDMTVGVGFEDLHIDGNLQEAYQHHVQNGRGGITLWHTAHSWVRRCRFSNTVDAFRFQVSYSSSALAGIVDGRYGHFPGIVSASTYCFVGLLDDYTDKGVWHGISVDNASAGAVVWKIGGKLIKGPDTHGAQPRHTLFDNYNSINHQASGGAIENLPHHLDGYTRWNNTVAESSTFDLWTPGGYGFAVTQGNLIGYKTLGGSLPRNAYSEGFGTHVSPDSLYEAQLARRLGVLPAWVDTSKAEYAEFFENVFKASAQTHAHPPNQDDNLDPSQGGPKIEGPWLWVLVPDERLDKSTDLLATASGGIVTEKHIATTGVSPGDAVGDYVWTSLKISDSGGNNITNMTRSLGWNGNNRVIYGFITLNSPREQNLRMFIGSDDSVKVWLNGELVREEIVGRSASDYQGSFPVTLKQGINTLLVAVENHTGGWSGFFGFQADAEYTVLPFARVGYALPNVEIYAGDTFTLDIYAEDVTDLAEWKFNIIFHPARLKVIDVQKGYFLESGGGATVFKKRIINNKLGKIRRLGEAVSNGNSVNGTGLLLSVTFLAKASGETQVMLQNFQFLTSTGQGISAGPHEVSLFVTGAASPSISVIDNIEGLDPAMIQAWLKRAQLEDDGSVAFREWIAYLHHLLELLVPEESALLANYPNPFNPETWIPYQLAEPAEVTLRIYAVNGELVRTLVLGQMPAGIYQSRTRAVYWDGKNEVGESVASGIYFYTLTGGNFTATRKMLIRK